MLGLWMLVAAIVAVILRLIVFLSDSEAGRSADRNIERFVDPT